MEQDRVGSFSLRRALVARRLGVSRFFEVAGVDIPVSMDHADDCNHPRAIVDAIEDDIRMDDVRPESGSNLFPFTSGKREGAQNALRR